MQALKDLWAGKHHSLVIPNLTDDEKKVFVYALDKLKTFGITCDIANTANLGEPTDGMFRLLYSLANRRYTGNKAKYLVENFANIYGDLIKVIINKKLRCGVSVTTFNKYYPRAIPIFEIQLAKAVPLEKIKFPCYGEIKYDGVRIIILIDESGCAKFFTRSGKEVNLPKTAKNLFAYYRKRGVMLDCEVTLESGKMEDRTSISGMINSAMHGGTIDENKLVFNVFDYMYLKDFQNRKCIDTHSFRRQELKYSSIYITPSFFVTESYNLETIEDAQDLYNSVIDKGYEGLILKHANHKYTFKRSKDWIKLKETKSADLKCISVYAGREGSKYEDYIGGLNCAGIVEGKQVYVSVGSGLSDEERMYLNEQTLLGKTIEVKYNTIIKDSATNTYSLFLPRFVCVRFDK